MASVGEKLMTVEEFAQLPANDVPLELVRGRIVEMNVPRSRHGEVLAAVTGIVRGFVRQRKLGRVMAGDSGVITTRDPDSLRGADVAFYSYSRVPQGRIDPRVYLDASPEVIFEIRSPDDRTASILEKVAEYLRADVLCVCVLDPIRETIHVYEDSADAPVIVLNADDELAISHIDDDFRVPVLEFFED